MNASRYCSVVIATLLFVPVISTAVAAETTGKAFVYVDDQDQSHRILGLGRGKVIVFGLLNACSHVRENFKTARPERIIVLLADRKLSKFSSASCVGKCDLSQMNDIIARCRQDDKIEGCVAYGAVFENKVHVLAIDGSGATLQESCKPEVGSSS